MILKTLLQLVFLAALSITIPELLYAQPTLLIDQENPTYNTGRHFKFPLSIGQEFIPTFDKLNYVEVIMRDLGENDPHNTPTGGTFAVRFRDNRINGPILGTSNTTELPSDFGISSRFGEPVQFTFENPVPVIPGRRTVMEFHHLSGDPFFIAELHDYRNLSLQGRAIHGTVPQRYTDIYFKVGLLSIPEPTSLALIISVATMLCMRRPNRAVKQSLT